MITEDMTFPDDAKLEGIFNTMDLDNNGSFTKEELNALVATVMGSF